MYHTLTIGALTIAMTGIGVIAFLIAFHRIVWRRCQEHQLPFSQRFAKLPVILISIYLLSSWVYYAMYELTIFPLSREQLLRYFSPAGREFSLIGIVIGSIIVCYKFLKNQVPLYRLKRVDSWFEGVARGLIPLGIFLTLGDSFIGVATDSAIGISAIKSDSAMAVYDQVVPIGMLLAVGGILITACIVLLKKHLRIGHGYAGLGWVAILLTGVTLYQHYPRRLISMLGDSRWDIKQYVLLLVAAVFFWLWRNAKKSRFNNPTP